ncbi:MAG: HAMP domain-containing histidine kinase, partial [Oscillibacter sp.]|nr:HAMP domain-containing histidine kinase [Oscillibacter sp.]
MSERGAAVQGVQGKGSTAPARRQILRNWMQKFRTKQWSIRDRVLVTLVLLTAAILLSVALAFHLFVRAYVWSHVSSQLDSIAESAASAQLADSRDISRSGIPDGRRKRKFDGGQDRITGVRGSFAALNADGTAVYTGLMPEFGGPFPNDLSEEWETAQAFSAYFSDGHTLDEHICRKPVSLDGSDYIVTVVRDPAREGGFLVCYVDVTAIQAFTRQVNLALSAVILAALALSVFLSRWFSRSFAEPVQRLSAFAGEIGQGNFRRRAFAFRDREFQALAESMNRMTDELKEANRKQETFFQNVSHELRTPLTSIRGCAEGIVYGLMDPKQSGNIILAEADRLAGFVEDILYLSRMGRAAPEGSALPLDLRDILSLCVSEQRLNAGELDFTFDFDDHPVLAAIRERDARELFGNLISNAIRYADR